MILLTLSQKRVLEEVLLLVKKVPEIRFKGFYTDWEQRKLGEEATIVVGGDIDKAKLLKSGKYPVLANALTNDGIVGYYEDNYRIGAPAVTVTGRGDVGYAKARRTNFTPVVRLLAVTSDHDIDFLEAALNNHKKIIESTGVPQLTSPQLAKYKILFPSLEEEKKIGAFFNQLDQTIALHLRKLQALQQLKKGFLQKMFPENQEKVPQIRFAHFQEEWEQRKVMDMSEETYGGGTPRTNNKEYWQGEFPWIQSSDLKNDQLCDVIPTKFITNEAINKSATKVIPSNSIAIVTRVGVGKLALIPYDYTTSQDFLSLSRLTVEPWFGVYSLYKLLKKEINNIQGTSIKGITKLDLLEKKIILPSSLEEQIKIGAFFQKLDSTIALHQSKLEHLQSIKHSLLQKMFL